MQALSLSSFIAPSNHRPPSILSGSCKVEGSEDIISYQITIQLEGKCSAKAEIMEEGRLSRSIAVKFQFPILNKEKFQEVLEKGKYTVKAHRSDREEIAIHLFSEKLQNVASKYTTYLNRQVFFKSGKKSLLTLEADQCKGEENRQAFLFSIIKNSKDQKTQTPAPINAIMILNQAGMSFSHQNFEGAKLRGVYLVGSEFYGADLKKADLRGAQLDRICWHQTDLRECQMEGMEIGRRPSIIHQKKVKSWDISADDRFLITCTEDNKIYIWNLQTHECLHTFNTPTVMRYSKKLECTQTAVFMGKDYLILARSPKTVSIWSLEPFQEVTSFTAPLQKAHKEYDTSNLREVACSPNGELIAVYHRFLLLSLVKWDPLTSKETDLHKNHLKMIGSFSKNLCFSLDSKWIVFVSDHKDFFSKLTIYSTDQNLFFHVEVEGIINNLTFSSNCQWLLGLSQAKKESSNSVVKWDLGELIKSQTIAKSIEVLNSAGISEFRIFPSTAHLAYSTPTSIYIRDLQTGEDLYQVAVKDSTAFKILNQGTYLLNLKNDQKTLDCLKVDLTPDNLKENRPFTEYAFFSPDSRSLMMLPSGIQLFMFVMQQSVEPSEGFDLLHLPRLYKFCEVLIRFASMSQSEISRIAAAFAPDETKWLGCCELSPKSDYALIAMSKGIPGSSIPIRSKWCVWNVKKDVKHLASFQAIYEEDDTFFKRSEESLKEIRSLQAHSTEEDKKFAISIKEAFPASQFEENSQAFFAISDDPFLAISVKNRVAVWDLTSTCSKPQIIEVTASILHMKFSKSNEENKTIFLASGNEIRQWNISHKQEKLVFQGHEDDVVSMDNSYDDRFLVSSSYDCTLRLWDIKTGKELQCIKLHRAIFNLKFSPNNRYLATYDQEEGVTYLWELTEGKLSLLLRTPKQLECRGANLAGVIGLSTLNQSLFKQLGAKLD